jgi:hypothetical protein
MQRDSERRLHKAQLASGPSSDCRSGFRPAMMSFQSEDCGTSALADNRLHGVRAWHRGPVRWSRDRTGDASAAAQLLPFDGLPPVDPNFRSASSNPKRHHDMSC